MPTTQQLLEKRANIWEQMKEVMALAQSEDRGLSAEESEKYDRAEADLDGIATDIERQQRHEATEKLFSTVDRRGVVPGEQGGTSHTEELSGDQRYTRAFERMLRGSGMADLDTEDRQLLMQGAMDTKEMRALGVGTGTAGGYAVPAGFRNQLIEVAKAYGAMLTEAETINTDSGQTLPWPTLDDTANVGAILGENVAVTQLDLALGTNNLDAYMYTSKLVLVSLQLLQDSAIDVQSLLARKLGERIGRILNQHFTTGTGTGQPDGIVTTASIGKTGTTGQTLSVVYADLVDLLESVDPAYQSTSKWMLGQSSRKVVRKLADSQNRPLWEPSLQAGNPDMLLGFPVVVNNDMPVMAANAKSILFGDFQQAYVIRMVTGAGLVQFNERYMDSLQKGFMAFQRADGTVQNSAAVKAYANSAT